jgi:membrane protein DedA with SNARE-associated domain
VKGVGYLISIFSVFLLAAGSLKTASQDPLLLACLIVGMISSIIGMLLRYWSFRRDRKRA